MENLSNLIINKREILIEKTLTQIESEMDGFINAMEKNIPYNVGSIWVTNLEYLFSLNLIGENLFNYPNFFMIKN